MFTRLRETVAILSYKHPEHHAHRPDVVFMEEEKQHVSSLGKAIGYLFNIAVIFGTSMLIGKIMNFLVPSAKTMSIVTITGTVVGLLSGTLHNQIHSIAQRLQAKLQIAETLSPYFGHKLEETYRVLKG